VTEASSPSLEQAPSVASNSPLLRNNAKAATQTPGIQWTDGEAGLERQVRKMNMYTVRGQRSFSSSSRVGARVFTPRKTFLYDQYSRILKENKVVLLLQHNSLSVKEAARIRREIEQVELPTAAPLSSKAKLTVARTGLLKPLLRRTASLKVLEPILSGPIALLTFTDLSPSYLGRVLSVIDKALGAGKAQPKPVGSKGHEKAAKNVNTRLFPLAGIVEDSANSIRVVDVAQLRDISLLPSLDELRGQLVARLSHTPSQLVSTLNQAKGVSLLQTLDARRRDLEKEESPAS
jgi:ribosomal protein L10